MVPRLILPQHLRKKKIREKRAKTHLICMAYRKQSLKPDIGAYFLYNIWFFRSYSVVFMAKSVMHCICSKFPYFCLSLKEEAEWGLILWADDDELLVNKFNYAHIYKRYAGLSKSQKWSWVSSRFFKLSLKSLDIPDCFLEHRYLKQQILHVFRALLFHLDGFHPSVFPFRS